MTIHIYIYIYIHTHSYNFSYSYSYNYNPEHLGCKRVELGRTELVVYEVGV